MKRLLFCVLVSAMICAVSVSAHAVPDFSGVWTLDVNKSDLGTKNPAAKVHMKKVVLIITQTTTKLSIERSTGDVASYNLDGSESINKLPGGGQSKTTTNWADDTLVSKTISNINGRNVTATDVRSLSSNGKEMVLRVSIQLPSGERKQTLVYTKQ